MEKEDKLTRVRFRVVEASGEDPEYPALELEAQSSKARGWQSARHCAYPQRLVLELQRVTQLRQLQVLSHQSKIASRIEVQVRESPSHQFRSLGKMSLDPNAGTEFKVRELKSVAMDVGCHQLRLVLLKNHPNSQHNPYNQVSLIAVSVYTDPGAKTRPLPPPGPVLPEAGLDKATLQQLKDIEERKARAVAQQDYSTAKMLKDQTTKLLQLVPKIGQLQLLKQKAVEEQDYDAAKRLFEQIKVLRESVSGIGSMHPSEKQPPPPPRLDSQQQKKRQDNNAVTLGRAPAPVLPSGPSKQQYEEVQEEAEEEVVVKPRPNALSGVRAQPAVPATNNNKEPLISKVAKQEEEILDGDERPIKPMAPKEKILNYKQQNQQEQQINEQQRDDDQEQLPRQMLTPAQAEQVSQYFSVIAEQVWQLLFSKQWQQREQGLKELLAGQGGSLQALLFAIKLTAVDKVATVQTLSFDLLLMVLTQLKPKSQGSAAFTVPILQAVLDRLADTNPRARGQAMEVVKVMAGSKLFGSAMIASEILKTKQKTAPKLLGGRLEALAQICGSITSQSQLKQILRFAIKQLGHASAAVRQSSLQVIASLGKMLAPEEIIGECKDLKEQIIESVKELIFNGQEKRVVGKLEHSPQTRPRAVSKEKQKVTKKEQPSSKQQSRQPVQSNNPKQQPKKISQPRSEHRCPFCEAESESLSHEAVMDMHLFKECRMTCICEQCQQVVPVVHFAAHLMSECHNASYYKKCSRCKEPVHQRAFKAHTDLKGCLPAKPPSAANRCPLCHEDIPPGTEGWKEHLLRQGCKASLR